MSSNSTYLSCGICICIETQISNSVFILLRSLLFLLRMSDGIVMQM